MKKEPILACMWKLGNSNESHLLREGRVTKETITKTVRDLGLNDNRMVIKTHATKTKRY